MTSIRLRKSSIRRVAAAVAAALAVLPSGTGLAQTLPASPAWLPASHEPLATEAAMAPMRSLAPVAPASVRTAGVRTPPGSKARPDVQKAAATMHDGPVLVAGSAWRTVPYLVYGGTTYFGIWYLQQLLRAYGIDSTWNGTRLTLAGFPKVVAATVTVSGSPAPGVGALWVQGEAYVDVSAIARQAGGTVSASGEALSITLPRSTAPSPLASGTAHPAAQTPVHPAVDRAVTVSGFQSNGEVYVGSQLWRRVPVLYSGGTTFFGVWYFQQFLLAYGIHSTWDGKQLAIDDLPRVVPQASITVDGADPLSGAAVEWQGDWYVPASALTAAGVPVQVQVDAGEAGTGDGAAGGAGSSASPSGMASSEMGPQVTLHGRLVFDGASYPVKQVSLRDVQTHAHYYADVQADGTFSIPVPPGQYEVFAAIGQDEAVYLLQPFTVPAGSAGVQALDVHLPALPQASRLATAHADVIAGDTGVSAMDLQSVADIFEHVYPEVASATGLAEQSRIQVTLYSSADAYQQHFLQEGYTAGEAASLAENSVAVEEGLNQISVQMPAFHQTDGLNVMAHELTHALVATVSSAIPSWANEGIAWEMGVDAELDGSQDPVLTNGIPWSNWVDTLTHQRAGDLRPLGQADPLDSAYNVELQDYWAVHQLITRFGLPAVMRYVRAIDHDPDAFTHTFGMSFDTFANQVQASLAQQAAQSDSGFTMRLAVLAGGPETVYITSPDGRAYEVSGLAPGNTYDISCRADGTVQAAAGLQVAAASGVTGPDGVWFVQLNTSGSLPRQGIAIADGFGVPCLLEAVLYDPAGQPAHTYPATALPGGLQVVGLTPLH